jgi:hypothetical protein
MEEISKEDLAMIEWLKNASEKDIADIMKSVDKEYFNE